MEIKARVFLVKGKETIKANASITIDDAFVVTGLKIMESKGGNLFVSFPSKQINGDYKDTCFPITKEARQYILDEVMAKYYEVINQELETQSDELPF